MKLILVCCEQWQLMKCCVTQNIVNLHKKKSGLQRGRFDRKTDHLVTV